MSEGSRDIGIAVYRLLTAGGLERHALWLAATLVGRGHRVTLYTTAAGEVPQGVDVHVIKRRGLSNQGRLVAFQNDLAAVAKGRHDVLVGFQKMAGLDILFCCDWCFADHKLSAFSRMLPRYRIMAELEATCFAPQSRTKLLMLAQPQVEAYREAYRITPDRLTVLPPTLQRSRLVDDPSGVQRIAGRATLGIDSHTHAWLWIGLQPHVKGLDRVIRALALVPNAQLFACGARTSNHGLRAALSLARRLGCANRIVTPGTLNDADLERHFLSADVLVHPARLDVTGTVIVEALGAGLPVIVTDNCGYAPHVAAAGAGVVVARDAGPEVLARAASPDRQTRDAWSQAARDYVRKADLTSGIDRAADIIEGEAERLNRHAGRVS